MSTGDGGAVTEAGFSLEQMVPFTWQAALGDRRLTKADLRQLEAAASAKRELVRVRGEWVQVAPGEIEAILRRIGTRGEATGGKLLRAGLSIDAIEAPDGLPVVGVAAIDQVFLGADEENRTPVFSLGNGSSSTRQ